jgi:cobalamin biosynthesis protein CobT
MAKKPNNPVHPDYDDYDGYDDYNHDDDYDNDCGGSGYSHSQQCWADRSDYAQEQLENGYIDPIQAAEIRMGA